MGLKAIPSVVQLPGGIRLKGLQFKITEYNPDGSPRMFELLPGTAKPPKEDGAVLFADESWARSPNPNKAH